MIEREELARAIGEAIITHLHKGGYAAYGTRDLDAIIDGELELTDVADALLADGWVKGREEWGVRYPECVNSGYKSQVAADLDAHHWNGTVVRRYVTDWEERE